MSNYHVRLGRQDGNGYEIIFHIPIPVGNNRIGESYRDVLVRSGTGGTTIMVEGPLNGNISTQEKDQVLAGEIYEHVEEITTNPGETALEYQSRLDARYNELKNVNGEFLGKLKKKIEYWGHDRNV